MKHKSCKEHIQLCFLALLALLWE